MIITHGKRKYELINLFDMYRKFFAGKVEDSLYISTCDKFCLYIYHCDERRFLEDFVQEYFEMKKLIVDTRNQYLSHIKSTEYKEDRIINKLRIRHKLRELQKLCEKTNSFEQEFFNKTSISLLSVENERFAQEQSLKIK